MPAPMGFHYVLIPRDFSPPSQEGDQESKEGEAPASFFMSSDPLQTRADDAGYPDQNAQQTFQSFTAIAQSVSPAREFDGLRMEDIFADQNPGASFEDSSVPIVDKYPLFSKHPEYMIWHFYTMMQYIAQKHPQESVSTDYYLVKVSQPQTPRDLQQNEIANRLESFLKKYPHLVPQNVTPRLGILVKNSQVRGFEPDVLKDLALSSVEAGREEQKSDDPISYAMLCSSMAEEPDAKKIPALQIQHEDAGNKLTDLERQAWEAIQRDLCALKKRARNLLYLGDSCDGGDLEGGLVLMHLAMQMHQTILHYYQKDQTSRADQNIQRACKEKLRGHIERAHPVLDQHRGPKQLVLNIAANFALACATGVVGYLVALFVLRCTRHQWDWVVPVSCMTRSRAYVQDALTMLPRAISPIRKGLISDDSTMTP